MDLLLLILVILVVFSIPAWPYNRGGPSGAGWGYGPVGIILTIVLILVVLRLAGVSL